MNEAAAQIGQHRITRLAPLLQAEEHVHVVEPAERFDHVVPLQRFRSAEWMRQEEAKRRGAAGGRIRIAALQERAGASDDGPQQRVGGQHRLVQVHLPVHEPPRDQEVFHGIDAFRLDHDAAVRSPFRRMHPERFDDALHADLAFDHACVERIAAQVIETVHVELAGDELVEEGTFVRIVKDLEGQFQRATEAFVQAQQEPTAHGFVPEALDELMFERVGERSVADVVQQGGGAGG